MNITNHNLKHPLLAMPLDRRSASVQPLRRTAATLSSRELKEIVAEMVG
jgi:hypothetical protein